MKKKSKLFQKFIDTASDVILQGVKWGLDEAGSMLLGPTAWKGFRQIVSPIIKRLQERYLNLSFDNPEDENAVMAANEAVNFFKNNDDLQDMLFENFSDLSQG